MKKLLVGLGVALAVFGAHAEKSSQDICVMLEDMAHKIMTARHKGAPLSEMLKAANSTDEPALNEVLNAYVVAAYKRPRQYTPEMQEASAREFATKAALECLEDK